MERPRLAADGGRERDSDADRDGRDDPDSDRADGGRDRESDRDRDRSDGDRARRDDDFSDWFADSAVRIALVTVGFVITIFALGQAVGIDFLGMLADALNSPTGQWLLVAFFGILLIIIAQRGFAAWD